jgi:hypothetical protein
VVASAVFPPALTLVAAMSAATLVAFAQRRRSPVVAHALAVEVSVQELEHLSSSITTVALARLESRNTRSSNGRLIDPQLHMPVAGQP